MNLQKMGNYSKTIKSHKAMKTLTTITGREIKVSSNKFKRTFTLRTNGIKYRTLPMPKDEFLHAEYWTGNDWNQFFKTDEYFIVK